MNIRLHHTGFVVKDIIAWEKNMLFNQKVKEVNDPIQQATLSLYSNYSDFFIELIQPMNEKSFTWNALQKFGNHFNHFCYEANSMIDVEKAVNLFKLIPVLGPVQSILFDQRQVLFYYTRNKQIVEFLV